MARLLPVDPFDLIIFGGHGDLALRKLMPALWHRHVDGQFSDDSRIIAGGRSPMDLSDYIGQLKSAVAISDEKSWQAFADRISYLSLDAEDVSTWHTLSESLQGRENVIRAFYLAMPPALFGPVAENIREAGLKTSNMRIVVEKPVGNDFQSAQVINDQVAAGIDIPTDGEVRRENYIHYHCRNLEGI